jgi:uncharacterized protein YeeX (DUF496 family)/ferritin
LHLLLKTPISKIGVLAKDENMAIERSYNTIIQVLNDYLNGIDEEDPFSKKPFSEEQKRFIEEQFEALKTIAPSTDREKVAYDLLLHRIKEQPKQEGNSIVSRITSIFFKHKLFSQYKFLTTLTPNLLKCFQGCPDVSSLIEQTENGQFVHDILEKINNQDAKKKSRICKDAAHLIRERMSIKDVSNILQAVSERDKKGREKLCIDASYLIRKDMSTEDVSAVLEAVSKLDEIGRGTLCDNASPLIQKGMSTKDVSAVLEAVSKLSEERKWDLCCDASPLIQKGMSTKDVSAVLEAVSKLSEKWRWNLCFDAQDLIQKGMKTEDVSAILEAVKNFSREGRKLLCFDASNLSQKLLSHELFDIFFRGKRSINKENVSEILEVVVHLFYEGRSQICRDAVSLIREDMSIKDVSAILHAVRNFREEARSQLCIDASYLIRKEMSIEDVSNILQAVSERDQKGREQLCSDAQDLIQKGMKTEDVSAILEAVKNFGGEGKKQLCFNAKDLIREGMSGEDVTAILEKVKKLPEAKEQGGVDLILTEAKVMSHMAKKEFLEVLSKENWIQAIKDRMPELIKLLPSYIEEQMQDEKNVPNLLDLFSIIEAHHLELGIPSEGILMNQVIACRCQIDPAVRDNKNSIYTIHQKMLAHKAEEVSSDTFLVSLEEGGEFNVGKVIEESGAKEEKPITYAELPNIDPDIFSKLFDNLSSKLTPDQKGMIEKEFGQVENMFGQIEKSPRNFEELRHILTHPSTVCYQLMHAPKGKPEEVVPVHIAKLYAIADSILTQTDEGYVFRLPANPDGSHLLTPQEERLMAFAETMDACKEGQEERIEAIYKVLPKKESKNLSGSKSYVTKAEETVFKNLEDLRSFLKKEVDVIVRQIESMTPFMKEVISKDPQVCDPVHQARYLKNLLKEDLGLDVLRALFKHYQQERGENLVTDLSEYVWSSLNEKLKWMDELKQANALISAARGLENSAATQSSSVNSMVTALQKDIQDTERNIRRCSEVLNEQTGAFSEVEGKKHKKKLQQQWEARRAVYEKKKEDLEKLLLEIKALPAKKKEATELFNAIPSLLENKGISTENLFDSEKLEEEGILQLRDDPEVKRRLLIALGFLQDS